MAAAISAPWNYALIRFFIGCAGPMFLLGLGYVAVALKSLSPM